MHKKTILDDGSSLAEIPERPLELTLVVLPYVAEMGQMRLSCILSGTPCGRCLRQAKTCCSDERFLLENVPVRARGRRAHEMCTQEVDLDDGGQTLMINYYSALLYCDKILNLRQKSLVRATRSAALTKQKVNTWYR